MTMDDLLLEQFELSADVRRVEWSVRLLRQIGELVEVTRKAVDGKGACRTCEAAAASLARINTYIATKRAFLADKTNFEALGSDWEKDSFEEVRRQLAEDSKEKGEKEKEAVAFKHKLRINLRHQTVTSADAGRGTVAGKRKRGRPRKVVATTTEEKSDAGPPKKKRGRPPKKQAETSETAVGGASVEEGGERADADDGCEYCVSRMDPSLGIFVKDQANAHKCTCVMRVACGEAECAFVARCKHRLTTHVLYHHRLRQRHSRRRAAVACDFGCGHVAPSRHRLNYHHETVHSGETFRCARPACPFTTGSPTALHAHVRGKHGEKRHGCSWPGCDFRSATAFGLDQHFTLHTGEMRYTCTWPGCQKRFRLLSTLSIHKRLEHEKRPPAAQRCPWPGCAYRTTRTADYRLHIAVHEQPELKRFACDWPGCDAAFHYPKNLRHHKQIHVGERAHRCTWPGCSKAFIRKDKLDLHHRIHTGDKRYKCQWPGCDYRAVLGGNVTKHFRQVHERRAAAGKLCKSQ